ncbi:MAG: ABC transporter ATP-binding protein [Deltaproteobacteria bacterium]|nr:MAG: ABC transporter ATP-binding protein [Deltaproteobacteria bacterium]
MPEAILSLSGVVAGYGEVVVLRGVSLSAEEGKITVVLGSNGSGKTTLMRTVMGVLPPIEGEITFRGESVRGLKTHQIARKGIALVPEGRRLWGDMTVRENLEMGYLLRREGDSLEERLEEVLEIFPHLRRLLRKTARTLSGGEQQMVAIGRALMGDPDMVLLDEPSLGLAPMVVAEVFRVIERMREAGKTVLLVEQNAKKAIEISDYVWVLENGEIRFSGPPEEAEENEKVRRAYLGL